MGPMAYLERRADGWPLCPHCGEDELWATESTEGTIVGCLVCGWRPDLTEEIIRRGIEAVVAYQDEELERLWRDEGSGEHGA